MVVLPEAQLEEVVNRLLRPFGGAVEQGEVEGAFGGHVVRRNGVQVGHAALDVIEREPARVHFLEEGLHGIHGFLVARGGRGFAQADRAVGAGQFDDNGLADVGAGAPGNGPSVGKLKVQTLESQFHGRNETLNRLRKQHRCFGGTRA